MKKTINTLVISGGGVKGVAFIGVFKCLNELSEKINVDIKRIYAISVGSIVGFLHSIGYTFTEMEQEIMMINMSELNDISIKTFVKNYGLDSGKKIMCWLENLIERKGYKRTITFKQLYKRTGIDLNIGSTNLNKYKDVFFNYSISPNLRIVRAIRMSIGIPLIFSAVKYKGDIYIDGGIINTYPIKKLKDDLENVLGLKIVVNGEREIDIDKKIDSIDGYFYNFFNLFVLQKEKMSTLSENYAKHTVFIDTNYITHTVNFDLTEQERLKLIDIGYCATKRYFEDL